MPDVVHLGKSLKCSWSNWILWFKGTRSTLAILYNLRREGEPELRMKLKKLLTEESVRNKDRMAVDPILLLTTPELLDVLKSVDRVVYTIVPEKYRMWLSNRPADVTVLVEDLQNAKSVAFTNGVAYCTEPSSKRIRFAAVERNVKLKVSTLKKKADLQTKLQEFHLSKEGTVPQLRERLKKHLDELQTSYTGTVNSIAGVSFERPSAVCALSDDILLVADDGSGCFKQVCLNFDGVGIQGTSTALATYPHPMSVVSVAFSKGNNCAFFTASGHLGGIFKLELSSRQVLTVLRNSEPTPLKGTLPVLQLMKRVLFILLTGRAGKCGSWIAVVFQYMLVKANKEQRMAVHYLLNFHSHMEFAVRVEHSTSLMHLQDV
ncbi:hypothetical protein OS493_016811 [Desmophyllum pertusum]|uniref:Uncharacterized protein n=1 Tax=Desmophyllum pertusum TaxID=174260 RepID=A0A9X0CTG0_9CNID|nr:hypothetical protein OS493_016811 [Desmophyllum pertusum]